MNSFEAPRPRKSFFVNKGSSLLSLVSLVGCGFILMPTWTQASVAATVASPFSYNFTTDGSLVESYNANLSTSPYWVVNSGGRMSITEGRGKTVHGELPEADYWRNLYAQANPLDTDNGYHPQNIFRLVGRSKWEDFRQQAYFKITKNQLSSSPNRNASNGVLLFNRYKDSANLYYTGLRVDGYAIIKKKVNGQYYTLGSVKVFPGSYSTSGNPNLLPKNTWLGVRSEVVDNPNGSVSIKLYTDIGWKGVWKLVAEAVDTGTSGPIVSGAGFGGIRTDFMDVVFDAYKIEKL